MARRRSKYPPGVVSRNGLLSVTYTEHKIVDGKKKCITRWKKTGLRDTAENLVEASRRREILMKRAGMNNVLDPNILVPNFMDHFLNKKIREVRDSTMGPYRYKCKHISDYFRNVMVKDIEDYHVMSFLDSLYADKQFSQKYIKDIRALFKEMMDYAVKSGVIMDNPVLNAHADQRIVECYAKTKEGEDDFFDADEMKEFFRASENHPLYDLFQITFYLGLRREEVLGLRWRVIDFKRKKLIINHTVTKGTKGINYLDLTKTEKSMRTLPLNNITIGIFKKIQKEEKRYRKLFGKDYKNPELDYVFRHQDGQLLYPDYPSKEFRKIVKKTPTLPQKAKLHSLRASCATVLIVKGLQIKEVQQYLGHSDIKTTIDFYDKVSREKNNKKIADLFDCFFGGEEGIKEDTTVEED